MPARILAPLLSLVVVATGCHSSVVNSPFEPRAAPATQPASAGLDPGGEGSSAAAPSGYVVDAMVGQVNGQAIYADQVLEPLDGELEALGRQVPPREFRRQAYSKIHQRVHALVADALIYGEAHRDLTEAEQAGLERMMQLHREELLRVHGRGSMALTQRNLEQQHGKTLEQVMEDERQRLIVEKLLYEKLMPRINVTKRDITRYYREHRAEFKPLVNRTLRVIRAANDQRAGQVKARLRSGESFASVAASELNTWKRDQAGLMEATGDTVFRQQELNRCMSQLTAGEHNVEPIEDDGAFWFVCVEALQRKPGQSLTDAQIQIEEVLRRQQFRMLADEYRRQLFARGNFDPLEKMAATLTEVAQARYTSSPVQSVGVLDRP